MISRILLEHPSLSVREGALHGEAYSRMTSHQVVLQKTALQENGNDMN